MCRGGDRFGKKCDKYFRVKMAWINCDLIGLFVTKFIISSESQAILVKRLYIVEEEERFRD